MRRLVPLCPPTKGVLPHAQGLRPYGLRIYVVICHFTFKKVSRIPHTTIPKPSGSKVMRRLVPSRPPTKCWRSHAQGLRSHGLGLCPHDLGIYLVICHFTFKKVFRIPHTTIANPQEARS